MAELELQSICKAFQHPVLDRLSLKVPQGEFFVIVGPSGIGKTTLLRCIAGLENLDGGKILFDGQDVTNVPPYQRGAAMTFESYALYPHKTVFENISSPLIKNLEDVWARRAAGYWKPADQYTPLIMTRDCELHKCYVTLRYAMLRYATFCSALL